MYSKVLYSAVKYSTVKCKVQYSSPLGCVERFY